MLSYIFRRLILIVPTLIGIMCINFLLVQFVPGGPVEQIISDLEKNSSFLDSIGGGAQEIKTSDGTGPYKGSVGLPKDFIDELEAQFGFDKPLWERFFSMMFDYITLDFGDSYFRSISVIELVIEKMPVSISLGLWTTLLAYMISIPLGIRKALLDGSSFDNWTSTLIIIGYSIPGFLFAIFLLVLFAGGSYLQLFPIRGLVSSNFENMSFFEQIKDYFWHIALPVLASTVSAFATLTLLTKNSFLDEIKKQYVTTARSKGLSDRKVLYGHVFRNAMLIIIAGFPGLFISVFFGSSLIIETIFSLDGLGRLGFEAAVSRDYPVVFGTLYIFGLLGLVVGLLSDLMYVWIDPRIDFEKRQS
ncbi:MAG: microcin C ABC transporter permease YejB [Paracoccaceae bacterium]|mgnify:FL=1|nr:MAG: microcin C ABC transporter permease YejB [Alphaproteobacteria bacterium]